MEENIWKPLGMNLTTFRLQERPDILSRRADMTMRSSNGELKPSPTRFFQDDAPDDHGGGGVFSCAGDYIKVLIALLKNDGTLLKPSSVDLLFTPCLPEGPIKALRENRLEAYQKYKSSKVGSEATYKVVPPLEMNYALGGQVSEKDWAGGRKAKSLSWGGLPNLSWVIDRKAGIAITYYAQLLPPGDPANRAAFERFENAVYSGELGNLGRQDLDGN
jgi:CubicO group peptidase (beta-lactamase class C family)